MEYTTSRKLYPGALSDEAAVLFADIWQSIRWTPCWGEMTKAQGDAFQELLRACYIESCAWGSYRVKGRDTLSAVRQYQQERNEELNRLYTGSDQLVTKWEARAAIINFRLRPWMQTQRVREAHLQHWQDVQETLGELRKVG